MAQDRKKIVQIALIIACLGGAIYAYVALSPEGPGTVTTGADAAAVQAPPPENPNAALRPTKEKTEAETVEFMTQRRGTTLPTQPN